ncbi:YbaB/EbfC family nucleoid-associated protein, partial [Saccharothrix coeruleofusca]
MTLEARRFAADRLTEVLARVTGTARHPSGLVEVTATATGELRAVRLLPAALGHGPDAVGRMVVETGALATDAAVRTSYNEVAKALGDSMAMAVESFAGPPPPP